MKHYQFLMFALFVVLTIGCQKNQIEVQEPISTEEALTIIQKNYKLIDEHFVSMGYEGKLYLSEDGTSYFIPEKELNTKGYPTPITCNQRLDHQGSTFRCIGSGNQCRYIGPYRVVVCIDNLVIDDMN